VHPAQLEAEHDRFGTLCISAFDKRVAFDSSLWRIESMSARQQTRMKATSIPTISFTPVQSGFLQRRYINQTEPSTVPPIVHEVLRSPGQPLDADTRAVMEPRFGRDFSGVRVHKDAPAAASARSLHASAYAVGNDVVFASGAYAPSTWEGRRLLAHELTHVIQQDGNGKRIQRWKDDTHEAVTQAASGVLANEDVIPLTSGRTEFVAKLKPYSYSTDYKARRILWTGPLFLSGAVEGEGPDHGEDGDYRSKDIGAAQRQNEQRQQQYVNESVGYYQQLVSSPSRRGQQDPGGPAIDRSDKWDVLAFPGLGAVGGAIGGTMWGYAAARQVSKAVGGGFWGGLLGTLTGLISVPAGLAAGTALGAAGGAWLFSGLRSRPATNARDGVFAALGDACHVAQDRAAHWEGVQGFGHTDPRTRDGWKPDDPSRNNDTENNADFRNERGISRNFGGIDIAVQNTRKVFEDWKRGIRNVSVPRFSPTNQKSRPRSDWSEYGS
jgi:hypothetical protein